MREIARKSQLQAGVHPSKNTRQVGARASREFCPVFMVRAWDDKKPFISSFRTNPVPTTGHQEHWGFLSVEKNLNDLFLFPPAAYAL